ncbi:MAG: hypothetical protein LUC24_00895 [Bacteroidales bacterium]|nr:hypothetical protein [Bacteroidales bacterium]
MSVKIRLLSAGETTGYEEGTEAENYIDLTGSDYRIYFFTNRGDGSDDTYITKFSHYDIVPLDGTNCRDYNLLGRVPDSLESLTDFKIVMLANWGNVYNDADLVAGETTIDDLCAMTWGQYSMDSNYGFGENQWIPFFGVQEFTGVTFGIGELTFLSKPVSLLRAVAKVEVRLIGTEADDDVDMDIASVRLCRYNEGGYCAPAGVTDGSYVTGSYTWDYEGIHLIGGANENQADATYGDGVRRLDFEKTVASEDALPDRGIYETWSVYVPEYSNAGDDYSYIEVMIENHEEILGTAEPFKIYFSAYSDGMVVDGGDYYDIQRNTLYRFNVTITDGVFRVIPQDWYATFDNDFNIVD